MSQHRFRHDGKNVLTGWDRPLQYFFLVVSKDEEDDDYIYSNLSDRSLRNGAMTAEQVINKLDELDIVYPVHLMDFLLDDKRRNAGNEVQDYGDMERNV
jgi:hypothetical protein